MGTNLKKGAGGTRSGKGKEMTRRKRKVHRVRWTTVGNSITGENEWGPREKQGWSSYQQGKDAEEGPKWGWKTQSEGSAAYEGLSVGRCKGGVAQRDTGHKTKQLVMSSKSLEGQEGRRVGVKNNRKIPAKRKPRKEKTKLSRSTNNNGGGKSWGGKCRLALRTKSKESAVAKHAAMGGDSH